MIVKLITVSPMDTCKPPPNRYVAMKIVTIPMILHETVLAIVLFVVSISTHPDLNQDDGLLGSSRTLIS